MVIINDKHSMENVVQCLNEWTEAYDKGQPVVSDKEWDDLYFQLKEAEERLRIILPNSPTQKVNYTVVNELKKVKHEYQPMLSLDKTKDIEDIKDFIGDKNWIAMLKLDGLTCRLTYEGGKLVRAETRGNGYEGEDVTHNAMVMPSIPKRISYYDTLVIDGEVVCDTATFEQFKNEYANARNFAAGSIRLLDSKECAKRGLTFVAWDIIQGFDYKDMSTLSAKLTHLQNYNFISVPLCGGQTDKHLENVIEGLSSLTTYPIDGIVFKWDNIKEYEAAGRTDHHFRGGMAYKFYDEEYETELLDIEWSMGRTGVLSPVAIYKTIEIDGAECSRANLHNLNTVRSILGELPVTGQKIWIYKANAIIPQVSRAEDVGDKLGIDPAYLLKDPEIRFLLPPQKCPVCGAQTEKRESDSGTIELYCSSDTCEGKLINRLEHFAGKKGLDIKGLSKATFEKLIDWGWVTRIPDLFTLDKFRNEWIGKAGFGVKSVDKILAAIEEGRECTLEQYLSAISIPLIGKTYARQLANIFEDYNQFRDNVIGGFDFTELDGFGPEKHDAIINFDYAEADRMFDMGIIKIKEKEARLENSGNTLSLEGLSFAITGKLKNYKNRDLLKAEIEACGGKVVSSVSSKTNYLVNNDNTSNSSKNNTAKSLGIPIITEIELLELMKNES